MGFHLLRCPILIGYDSFQASPKVLYIFPDPAKRCAPLQDEGDQKQCREKQYFLFHF